MYIYYACNCFSMFDFCLILQPFLKTNNFALLAHFHLTCDLIITFPAAYLCVCFFMIEKVKKDVKCAQDPRIKR